MTTLTVHSLSVRVGDRTLFTDLSLSLKTGDLLVLQGPSGSGKSLLLRAIAYLIEPTSGTLTLAGRGPEEWGVPAWRSEITYVPQRPASLATTPAAHHALIAELAAQRARPASDPIALAESWGLPCETWDKSWTTLSGGEAQRVALAIAISRQPSVLLLDEPTSALDPVSTAKVEASLADRTVIWVTHDTAQAERLGGRRISL